jgi:hypothetical protein
VIVAIDSAAIQTRKPAMQQTTLYKNSRIFALAILAALTLAGGAVAAILINMQKAAPPHHVDYVGRFVVTPNGTEFVPPTEVQEKLTSSASRERVPS